MNYKSLNSQIIEAEALLVRLRAEKESREEEAWKVFIFQSDIGFQKYNLAVAVARTAEEARELIAEEANRICLDFDLSRLNLAIYYDLDGNDCPAVPLAYLRMSDNDYLPF